MVPPQFTIATGYTWTSSMSRLARRFLFLVSAVLVTLAIGTAGFVVIAGYPPFDAFYMTLITMTTVGYSEIHPLGQAGRIFNSLDRKSTRLNSSHMSISYAVFCLKKKNVANQY